MLCTSKFLKKYRLLFSILLFLLSSHLCLACNISLVAAIVSGSCTDETVLVRVIVNYTDAPGELNVNGYTFPVPPGSSENQKNLYIWMPADGSIVDVHAFFTDQPSCSVTEPTMFIVPCCLTPGATCDDGNDETENDAYDDTCNCIGECLQIGNICDDGKADTYDDVYNEYCDCEGTACPYYGTLCDDGDPTTFFDFEDGYCNCQGSPCPTAGTFCNDADNTTYDDMEDGFCNCVGTPCPTAGTACDDGNATTINDVEDGFCNCVGEVPSAESFKVSIKMYLEAFFDGTYMNVDLQSEGLLPNQQPFAPSVLAYFGTENLSNYPKNINHVVDWVLLALIDTNGDILDEKACVVTRNGLVADCIEDSYQIQFDGIAETDSCHLAVFHKSHLAVVSDVIYTGAFVNFSLEGIAIGNSPTKPIAGEESLIAGDLNQDGLVNNLDFNVWQIDNALVMQYVNQDIDGNGLVNNLDFNLWDANKSKVGHSFIRF